VRTYFVQRQRQKKLPNSETPRRSSDGDLELEQQHPTEAATLDPELAGLIQSRIPLHVLDDFRIAVARIEQDLPSRYLDDWCTVILSGSPTRLSVRIPQDDELQVNSLLATTHVAAEIEKERYYLLHCATSWSLVEYWPQENIAEVYDPNCTKDRTYDVACATRAVLSDCSVDVQPPNVSISAQRHNLPC